MNVTKFLANEVISKTALIHIRAVFVFFIVSPKYKKSAPLRYARRMANYPRFLSDSWLFCTCGLYIF